MTSQQYLILIIEKPWNPDDYAADDFESEMVAHRAFSDAVRAAGQEVTAGDALDRADKAFRVSKGSDGPVFTDAPFGEISEIVSGYYQISADTLEQAKQLAALVPTGGHVDVFPVFDTSQY
jgi:hypothetical protein